MTFRYKSEEKSRNPKWPTYTTLELNKPFNKNILLCTNAIKPYNTSKNLTALSTANTNLQKNTICHLSHSNSRVYLHAHFLRRLASTNQNAASRAVLLSVSGLRCQRQALSVCPIRLHLGKNEVSDWLDVIWTESTRLDPPFSGFNFFFFLQNGNFMAPFHLQFVKLLQVFDKLVRFYHGAVRNILVYLLMQGVGKSSIVNVVEFGSVSRDMAPALGK
ncbi:UNVERIFIED_CONTAM: hypothetical protein NCL1_53403 [Trichonephila clavipes]